MPILYFFLIGYALCITNDIVIAGGGTGADEGDINGWNYALYSKLFDHLIKRKRLGPSYARVVVITGFEDPTEYLPRYLGWLGTKFGFRTDSRNYKVIKRQDANNVSLVGIVASADIIFISGGDQGQYYHEWKNTILHENIKKALDKGASIGGTSAGAMIIAGYSLSGGQDLITTDVLKDAMSPLLDDKFDGNSSIHADFLPLVKNAIVDTHVTERVRLGRLTGVLAKAIDDFKDHKIVGIGLEQQTGLWIHGEKRGGFWKRDS